MTKQIWNVFSGGGYDSSNILRFVIEMIRDLSYARLTTKGATS